MGLAVGDYDLVTLGWVPSVYGFRRFTDDHKTQADLSSIGLP